MIWTKLDRHLNEETEHENISTEVPWLYLFCASYSEMKTDLISIIILRKATISFKAKED